MFCNISGFLRQQKQQLGPQNSMEDIGGGEDDTECHLLAGLVTR